MFEIWHSETCCDLECTRAARGMASSAMARQHVASRSRIRRERAVNMQSTATGAQLTTSAIQRDHKERRREYIRSVVKRGSRCKKAGIYRTSLRCHPLQGWEHRL